MLNGRIRVLPLDQMDAQIGAVKYDLALNIHSFTECTYAAIEWWLHRLKQMQVRHLMIVPNEPSSFLSMEIGGNRRDYAPLLKDLGYELVVREPVFDDPVVQSLIGVHDNMFLFELR